MSSCLSALPNPASFDHFINHLTKSIDLSTNLRVYHVSTPAVTSPPVFVSSPGQPDEPTTCESHFLTISQPHVTESADVDPQSLIGSDTSEKLTNHVLVLGIEVLIFSTESLNTIFVSKADSTGFLSRPSGFKRGSSSLIQIVVSTFLEWLVARQLTRSATDKIDGTGSSLAISSERDSSGGQSSQVNVDRHGRTIAPRLVLSLFARSQNQYLFPGSVENSTKHVLDDRQLIKWWCRLLDGLVQKGWQIAITGKSDVVSAPKDDPVNGIDKSIFSPDKVLTNAYVVVPGCDRIDTIRSFFPPSAKALKNGIPATWHNSYPVDKLTHHDHTQFDTPIPIRCLIPRLPDDPKARYCDDLDGAGIDSKGQWKDVRSLRQFWEMIEYRQECAAGRLVGFVWIVFESESGHDGIETEANNLTEVTQATTRSEITVAVRPVTDQVTPIPAPHTIGSIILTKEQYIELSDLLIDDTDFAGAELAIKSTNEWIEKVKEMASLQTFGIDVRGQKVVGPVVPHQVITSTNENTPGTKHARDDTPIPVNMLTGIKRRKQKVEVEGVNNDENVQQQNGHGTEELTNAQKEKPAEHTSTSTTANGVKILSAGLIRKKVKVGIP